MIQKNNTDHFNKIIRKDGDLIFREFEESIKKVQTKKEINQIIKDIASKKNLKKKLLEDFLKHKIFLLLSEKIDIKELIKLNLEKIKKDYNIIGLNFIELDLRKILEKSLYLTSRFGFKKSVSEKGIKTANEGDSVQFLFVARAILAGFNCSNVDLRSSKYDAIIDYDKTLLRIQVKGISLTGSISFFNRSRGGQGIDYKHESNQGKRITSQDCDLYIAVNKETGLCYIIPIKWADQLTDKEARFIPQSKLKEFEENWAMIEKTAIEKTAQQKKR